MAGQKTTPTDASVDAFVEATVEEARRGDAGTLLGMMSRITGEPPKMWGSSIIGFGSYHYRYASGREGDWMLTGFSPRKRDFSIYVMAGLDRYPELMKKLGRYRAGKSCLYVRRLADIDLHVLEELLERSVGWIRTTYG
ncbi:MAG: DUF1801 domain-containing protein [Gammaproteobacteria bacterium]